MSESKAYYSLTEAQKRVWYTQMIYSDSTMFSIGGSVRVKGQVNLNKLKEAICIFVNSQDSFQIRLCEQNGEPLQYFKKDIYKEVDYHDFSKEENSEQAFEKWSKEVAETSFNLLENPLFYFSLFKIDECDSGYLMKFHHIIADGWSTQIMSKNIVECYMGLLENKEIKCNPATYKEFIKSEAEYLKSDKFLKNKQYWNDIFKSLPEEMPSASDDVIAYRKSYYLTEIESKQVRNFCSQNGVSINAFFITVYLTYLYKLTGNKDNTIGNPVLGRLGKKERNIFGMFVSSMPFRYVIDEKLNIAEMSHEIDNNLRKCLFNQKYPYNYLAKDLNLKQKGYSGLYNVCVNYYNTKHITAIDGSPVINKEFFNGQQDYSLQIIIREWSDSDELQLDFDYKLNDYSPQTIDAMFHCIKRIICTAIKVPDKRIASISLIDNFEKEELVVRYNRCHSKYPNDKSVVDLFREQVIQNPDGIAVRDEKNSVKFHELDKESDRLAAYLQRHNVTNNDIVGLLTYHSIDTIIAILGVLKAGCAYLPIDVSNPEERIQYLILDAGIKILLTNTEFEHTSVEIIHLHNKSIWENKQPSVVIQKPDDLVYVIYTSGSTGKPKGVMVTHQCLVNYAYWAKKIYTNGNDVFPLYSSLAFDLTVTSIFVPLIGGGEIYVYPNSLEDTIHVVQRIVKHNKSTIIKLTPSHLSLIKDMDVKNSRIRVMIVGGEDLKVELAKEIQKKYGGSLTIYNEYGPTETTVGCMIHPYNYENDTNISVPIGIPADNVDIYVLDRSLNPMPRYMIGEMYISGDGVAKGYLNSSELTDAKFINNPFCLGTKMYKSGDLARFIDGNILEYVGRKDRQVKIHGHRIEISEIERYLLQFKGIHDAAVTYFQDSNNGPFLCAYAMTYYEISSSEINEYLSKFLPVYMIPKYFLMVDELPLTINGKIDWEKLPKPQTDIDENIEFTHYKTEKEKVLADVICNLFGLKNISMKHNFFHIGGDSIKAIQVASRLNDRGFKIKIIDILSNPIVEEMACYLEELNQSRNCQEPCEGNIKPTPIVSWFFTQNFKNPNYYIHSILLNVKKDIEINKLEYIFNKLIKHHDALRINYDSDMRRLYYNDRHLSESYHIREHDLSKYPHSAQMEKMALVEKELKSSFYIENDILIQSCIFTFGDNHFLNGEKKWLIMAHHLVVDGVSWRILLNDICLMLKQISENQEISLPLKSNSYQEWASELSSYQYTEDEVDYWKYIQSKVFDFPPDHDLGVDTTGSSDKVCIIMSEEETDLLLTQANIPYNTEPKDLLITSLLKTLSQKGNTNEIVIELEGHGRNGLSDHADIVRTVGWFTSIYPFCMNLKDRSLASQIKDVKESLRKIPNKGVGFGVLKYLTKKIENVNRKYIRFNYLGDFSKDIDYEFLDYDMDEISISSDDLNELTYLVDINCMVINKSLKIEMTFSLNKYLKKTMDEFLGEFVSNLRVLVNHCSNTNITTFTPSDFDMVELSQSDLETLFS